MSTDSYGGGDLSGVPTETLIQSILAEASSLGLKWLLRPATVLSESSRAQTTIVYDGDSVPISAAALTPYAFKNTRVMVLFVPPAGNYIIGPLNPHDIKQFVFVQHDVDQEVTGTTLVDADDLYFFVQSGGIYHIKARLAFGASTAGDIRVNWTVPGTSIMERYVIAPAVGLTTNIDTNVTMIRRGAATQQTGGGSGGTANNYTAWWEDIVLYADAGGRVQLAFAQGTADATPTILRERSFITVDRVR